MFPGLLLRWLKASDVAKGFRRDITLPELTASDLAGSDLAGRDLAGSDDQRSVKEFGGRRYERQEKKIDGSCTRIRNHGLHVAAQKLGICVSTALQLGAANLGRVTLYRILKRAGIYRRLSPLGRAIPFCMVAGPLYNASVPPTEGATVVEADALLNGRATYFSAHVHEIGNPPDWFLDPFRKQRHPEAATHWTQIADFNAHAGDIKVVWELSRFNWALVFARAWRSTGDARYFLALQRWIEDWCRRNPANTGPNWMCGQETSIRLMNALLAWRIAGVENDGLANDGLANKGIGKNGGDGLSAFVEAHCRRIALTVSYAIAQDNNHATSEAAALYMGGTWLARYGGANNSDNNGDNNSDAKSRGRRWARKGGKQLNSRVQRLVLSDGSFSQHSLTYHRVLLDTLSIVEVWRREMKEAPFREALYQRAAAATGWLGALIDPGTGDGPNLGPNDGAHPFRLDGSAYRDFRPCLQLASFLFLGRAALKPGPWDEAAAWLGVPIPGRKQPWLHDLASTVFREGGFVVMRNRGGARLLMRAPTARFRPSHADALHLDLWCKGRNLLRDGGSYAYSGGGAVARSLASVIGHNSVQFDGHDQMLRISRFLYGGWVRVNGASAVTTTVDGQSWEGSCTNVWGQWHQRTVSLNGNSLSVVDRVRGFKRKAVLRWHLAPGNWTQTEQGCTSAGGDIRVQSTVPLRRMRLEKSWESRHYLEKSRVPVLRVEIEQSPAVLTTTVTLS